MDKRLEEFHETTGGTDPDFDKLYDFLKLQIKEIKKLKEDNKRLIVLLINLYSPSIFFYL